LRSPFAAEPAVGVTPNISTGSRNEPPATFAELKGETKGGGNMSERIIVLRTEQPRQVLVDVCSALADAINEPHAWLDFSERSWLGDRVPRSPWPSLTIYLTAYARREQERSRCRSLM
jgi:hypothetical protein